MCSAPGPNELLDREAFFVERCPHKGVTDLVYTCKTKAVTMYFHQQCNDFTELAEEASSEANGGNMNRTQCRTVSVGLCCLLCVFHHKLAF